MSPGSSSWVTIVAFLREAVVPSAWSAWGRLRLDVLIPGALVPLMATFRSCFDLVRMALLEWLSADYLVLWELLPCFKKR